MRKAKHRSPRLECLENRQLLSVMVAESEPNNRKSEADVFAFDSTGCVRLEGTSSGKKDKDFFKFVAPTSGGMSVSVAAGANGVLASLEIEDAAGADVFETEPNDGVNSGVATLTAGTTYYVRLRAKTRIDASYLVDLVLEGAPGGGTGGEGGGSGTVAGNVVNEVESNNTKGTANAFSLIDGAAELNGSSANKNDKDFFVFTAAASGTLSVNVEATGGEFAALEVEDALGADVFETEPNDGVNSGSFAVTAGVKYFVRLRAKGSAAAGYRVSLSLS